MSLLKTIKPEEATGAVAEIYKKYEEELTKVPNVIQMYSTNAKWLYQVGENLKYFSEHESYHKEFFFLMRILIADFYKGEYCLRLNTAILKYLDYSAEELEEIKKDHNKAKIPEKEIVLLSYIVKVATNPDSSTNLDIIKLKEFGWKDDEIFDALFNAVTFSGYIKLVKALKITADF